VQPLKYFPKIFGGMKAQKKKKKKKKSQVLCFFEGVCREFLFGVQRVV
jgi:hypothetical protein